MNFSKELFAIDCEFFYFNFNVVFSRGPIDMFSSGNGFVLKRKAIAQTADPLAEIKSSI